MSKLLSMLIAAVFAVSAGSTFAASHVKAAGDKAEMSKEMKKPAKKAKKAKKAKAEKKEEMKKEGMKK